MTGTLASVDVARPQASVVPTLEGDVLVVLAGTTGRLTGRQIARLVRRGSPAGVQGALNRLTAQGVVDVEHAGSASLYSLNRDHVAAPAIEALTRIREDLLDRLRTTIAGWRIRPSYACLFGSAARRDGDNASDIDVLIVRPRAVDENDERWRDQVHGLETAIHRWTGNYAGIAELSWDDAHDLRRRRPEILQDLERDAIDLTGTGVRELIEAAP